MYGGNGIDPLQAPRSEGGSFKWVGIYSFTQRIVYVVIGRTLDYSIFLLNLSILYLFILVPMRNWQVLFM